MSFRPAYSSPFEGDALHRLTEGIVHPERLLVSLKSIAGYRTGLAFEPPSAAQRQIATEAYRELRSSALVRN